MVLPRHLSPLSERVQGRRPRHETRVGSSSCVRGDEEYQYNHLGVGRFDCGSDTVREYFAGHIAVESVDCAICGEDVERKRSSGC